MKWVIASGNAKKRGEIAAILAPLGIDFLSAKETIFVDVDEDQDSFSGNAQKKAEAFTKANGKPALADDSGLCVDVLKGAPGIYSARFAGESCSDIKNNQKLLKLMQAQENRHAYFVCALHVAFPSVSESLFCEGRVQGEILHHTVGQSGFGYDPLFFCPELNKAFALATPEEKASVSHRGRALRALVEMLPGQLKHKK
ncbi:MAG: RdgB/HAM1 family non-canonical purine NTP pyrophosphatase [Mariprofundaceae bacterium]|nr:RdgB/HAM1 family non-canonical purine NTP pyrophosphatase [Mariprofundaceae bacterium]